MTARTAGRKFSARRGLVLGFGGAAVLIGGVLGWSVLASVSGAVIAPGVVGVETRNQVVEHIDGGTVSEILVRDGDRVAQNDVLLRFADGLLRSEEALLRAQHVELVARRNRLAAEFRGADAIVWDKNLSAAAAGDPEIAAILDGQKRLFRARAAARAGEVAQLRERIGQARDEIAGLEAQAVSLKQQLELVSRELEAQRSLFKKGLSQLARLLTLERTAKNLEGQSGANAARIARVRGSISELEIQILQIDLRRIEEAEERAREISAQENQVKERLASLRERLDRMEVRAPVAGEVFGMTVFAPREVVRPGEPILKIVPADAPLVVMAKIQPIDVDQVYPGQPAVLRFSAFPARETPEFDGRVLRVSADAVRDENTGTSWYEVELTLDRPASAPSPGKSGDSSGPRTGNGETAGRAGEAPAPHRLVGGLAVTPGMPVEAHIRTADRSIVSYLVKPVTDFFYRSLREE